MNALDQRCINTIRMLSADAVEKARSGHPGMPMGAAAMAYVLWTRFLRHNPANPRWPNRDRFVLSAGHGSMLLYALLHLTGYDVSLQDLENFRQWESKTPGHPEFGHTPGVETTTGPLGQGFANAVGMAVAERYLAAHFNRPGHEVVDHHIYAIISDGDLMEGISHEAASLAGHLGLGKLIYLYDDNHISIEGDTAIAFSENRVDRFRSYGWHVQAIADGNDLAAVTEAIESARREAERPSFIAVRTQIGFGSPNKQGTAGVHGEPLGPDELAQTKRHLNWPLSPPFHIPPEVSVHFRKALDKGRDDERKWRSLWEAYQSEQPESAAELRRWWAGELADGWRADIPRFAADARGMATRAASGKVLNGIAPHGANLFGGSADLAPSTKTLIDGRPDFQKDQYSGRNLRFGVREHAMGAILNGMALEGGLIPYGATFLIFSDYMRPAVRLAALMSLHVIYVWTHDSIGLGEDGPTHQPIEHLAALRSIPNLTIIRPCDANETAQAWQVAIMHQRGPVGLVLTRQSVPVLDRTVLAPAEGVANGAYILQGASGNKPDIILLASGSEVHIALAAASELAAEGVAARVVSFPSWELFERQPASYQAKVLPDDVDARLAVEAGSPQGWHRYVGRRGAVVGLDHFGASAPYETLFERFGLTAAKVVEKALQLVR